MLSIVIPAYNEKMRLEKTLQQTIAFKKNHPEIAEIIVVDDGSTDNTSKLAKKYTDKVIILPTNRGKGYAVKKGILLAKEKYVLYMDSDLATPLKEIPTFLKTIKKYDLVIGSRNTEDANITSFQPMYRRILGKIFPFIANAILPLGVKDSQCGFKMFKTSVAKKIVRQQTIERFAFDVELLYLARKKEYRIKEIGITWHDQKGSTVNTLKDGLRMLKDICKLRLTAK